MYKNKMSFNYHDYQDYQLVVVFQQILDEVSKAVVKIGLQINTNKTNRFSSYIAELGFIS